MTLKNRLQRVTNKLKPNISEIYCIGWSNCTWTRAEGLEKLTRESHQEFIERVIKLTNKKRVIWFT